MKNTHIQKPESRFIPYGVFGENSSLPITNIKKHGNKAVFLDRDGTINVERGYLLNPDDIQLNPTAGEAISGLNKLNIFTIVITNQASIDKRLLSIEQFEKVNEKLWKDLTDVSAYYDALYFCPHSPEVTPDCQCRKPKPGLILQAAKDFNIDLTSSFMIGDKLSDIEAGQLSGCKTILLLSGHGEKAYKDIESLHKVPPDYICQTLGDAVTWMLSNFFSDQQAK